MKRKMVRAFVSISVIILIIGTALAVDKESGVLKYVLHIDSNTPNLESAISTDIQQQGGNLEEACFQFQDAMFDGHILRFSIIETPKSINTALIDALLFGVEEDAMQNALQYGSNILGTSCEIQCIVDENGSEIEYRDISYWERKQASTLRVFEVVLDKEYSVDTLIVKMSIGIRESNKTDPNEVSAMTALIRRTVYAETRSCKGVIEMGITRIIHISAHQSAFEMSVSILHDPIDVDKRDVMFEIVDDNGRLLSLGLWSSHFDSTSNLQFFNAAFEPSNTFPDHINIRIVGEEITYKISL